ncbi:rRNA maturation RNase YbeY [Eubacteriales bacterium OttesenSCG-928-M02]|nr:rRNA maturation RNase YbeY [Eubacteriales bacterium OttesenSCG-928-M02]
MAGRIIQWALWLEDGPDLEERAAMEATLEMGITTLGIEEDVELSLVVCGEADIQAINLETRGVDGVTDVLSFPSMEWAPDVIGKLGKNREQWVINPENGHIILGEIILCLPRARQQAAEYAHGEMREFCFLAIHGFLHLMGYDHETPQEEQVMFSLQEKVLSQMGIGR